jgi:hypothetical protein
VQDAREGRHAAQDGHARRRQAGVHAILLRESMIRPACLRGR